LADKKEKEFHYGGQAVMEGVMMRGPKDFAVTVRKANGEIVTTREDVESTLGRFKWLDKPFLRGTLALIDSMALGIKALKYSADIAMTDAMEAEAAAKAVKAGDTDAPPPADQAQAKSSTVNDVTIGVIMVIGLALGVALFMLVPIFIVRPLKSSLHLVGWQLTGIEGLVKITLFLAYVSAISLLKDIRRVFQYHGAEHKTINAYEDKVELTVENVMKYGKAHVRCGTSFILVVLVSSIIVFMFIGWKSILMRFVYKLILLPFVAGIAYEVIRFAGKHKDSLFARMLVYPGLLMQKITTREPEPGMIEVAIKSLQSVLEREAAHRDEAATASS